ncbi:MAG TPA: thioredoxin domain-containing protein [Myxococcaceae bacterium]|nr:thioredoxin domain-containing protein [Myxococcaceae bacterium]
MKPTFKIAALVSSSTLLLLAGCEKGKSSPASAGASASSPAELSPETVVATIGSEKVTAAQLDDSIKSQLQGLEKQKFQLRKQGLDKLVMDKLIKAEAAKKGMTQEQYVKSEIEDKVPPPSDQQVQDFFNQNKARLPPDSKLETFKPQIVNYLTQTQRQQRAQTVYDQLRKENKVVVKLSEPRQQVEAKGPARGPNNAPITLVEFSDFQCPFCGKAHDTVEQVMQSYAGKVRLVFRHFPLEFHKNAEKAAEASMCANEQGKFWEYHDVLFKNQQTLEVPQLKDHATEVGLDGSTFATCLDSGKYKKAVDEDMAAGQKVGVSGTPAFFINGVMLSGAQPFDEFKKVIDQELGVN